MAKDRRRSVAGGRGLCGGRQNNEILPGRICSITGTWYKLLAELDRPRSPRRKLYQKSGQVRPYEIFKVISPPPDEI
jgi:hypothetical protein